MEKVLIVKGSTVEFTANQEWVARAIVFHEEGAPEERLFSEALDRIHKTTERDGKTPVAVPEESAKWVGRIIQTEDLIKPYEKEVE